jgi:hypothetical protein
MINLILFIAVFGIATFGSTYLMQKRGYQIPTKLNTKQDWLLLVYKLVLMSLIAIVQIIILMLFGIKLF